MNSHKLGLFLSGMLFLGVAYSGIQHINIPQPAYTNSGNDLTFVLLILVMIWALGYGTGRLYENL